MRGEGAADLMPGDGLANCSELTRGEGIKEEKRDLNKTPPGPSTPGHRHCSAIVCQSANLNI